MNDSLLSGLTGLGIGVVVLSIYVMASIVIDEIRYYLMIHRYDKDEEDI